MKQIAVFFLAFFVLSCSNNPVPKPKVLLDEEVMVNILFDVAILQAADGSASNKLSEKNIQIETFIYKKYKIDSTIYYQNNRYYAGDVRKYKKMHQEIIERLDKLNSEIPSDGNIDNMGKPKPVYLPQ